MQEIAELVIHAGDSSVARGAVETRETAPLRVRLEEGTLRLPPTKNRPMRHLVFFALLVPCFASAQEPPVELNPYDGCPDRYLSETFVHGVPCWTASGAPGFFHEIAHFRIISVPAVTVPAPNQLECVDGATQQIDTTVECIPHPLAADPSWTPFHTLMIP